jgi:hypothetical protein
MYKGSQSYHSSAVTLIIGCLESDLCVQEDMGGWTSLSEVEESRGNGDSCTFPAACVWIANFVAPNPYPRRFVYQACPERLPSGRICSKSLEFGPCLKHDSPPIWKFRFQVVVFDAIHGGIPPLHVNMWDAASVLLGCSPEEFSGWGQVEQVAILDAVMESTPRAEIVLRTTDKGVSVQHLALLDARRLPNPVRSPRAWKLQSGSSSTSYQTPDKCEPPCEPTPQKQRRPYQSPAKSSGTPEQHGNVSSTKKLFQDLCKAIRATNLSDSE